MGLVYVDPIRRGNMMKTLNVFEISTAIFKRDSNGKVRIWWYETGYDDEGNWAWRANSGIHEGKIVTSEWKFVEQKNVGRSNETTLEMQASNEALAEKVKKRDSGYFDRIEDIDTFTKFSPMLAASYDKVKFDFPVFAQPKLDGIRCIARKDGLWTRAGKEIVSCPHVHDSLKVFFDKYPDAVLDGELYNHDLRDNFNKITSLVRKTKPTQADIDECAELVEYHIYDWPSDKNFGMRYRDMVSMGFQAPIIYVPTYYVADQDTLDNYYGEWLEDGFEGQMVRIDKPYEQDKRSKSLLKRKEFLDAEFKVLRIEEGVGNWSGHIKRFVLELPDGREFGSNVRGTQAILKKLLEDGKTPEWATCRYFTPTPDGIPRFPVVTDWGMGKRED